MSEPTVGILGIGLSIRLAGYARCQEDGTEAAQENDFKVSACHKSPRAPSLPILVGIRELACELRAQSVPTASPAFLLGSHSWDHLLPGVSPWTSISEQAWKVPFFSQFHGFRKNSTQHRAVSEVHGLPQDLQDLPRRLHQGQ